MSNIQQITDRWNYIQGGFTYIDGNKQCDISNTAELSMAELRFFISSLKNVGESIQLDIVNGLNLNEKEQEFDPLPKSFLIMLDCDNDYLKSEPQTPLNSEFGSVAIAMLYPEVAEACGTTSPLPDLMLQAIAAKTGRQPITE
jgi:hypothetical protein